MVDETGASAQRSGLLAAIHSGPTLSRRSFLPSEFSAYDRSAQVGWFRERETCALPPLCDHGFLAPAPEQSRRHTPSQATQEHQLPAMVNCMQEQLLP